MIRFHAPAPWPQLAKALKSAKRRIVVTPFIGKGVEDMLHLRDGDVLIVNATVGNVRSGNVNPNELLRIRRDGAVRLFTAAPLHAKVYVADDRVFIGSMNASQVSRDSLVEACIETTERQICRAVVAWVQELMYQPLTREQLDDLVKEYRPAKTVFRRKKGAPRVKQVATWILNMKGTIDAELTSSNQQKVDRATEGLDREIEPFEIWMGPGRRITRAAKPGDEVFIIDRDKRDNGVYAPRRILVAPLKQVHKGKRKVVIVTEPRGRKTIPYAKFQAVAKSAGVALPQNAKTIRSVNHRAAVLLRQAFE